MSKELRLTTVYLYCEVSCIVACRKESGGIKFMIGLYQVMMLYKIYFLHRGSWGEEHKGSERRNIVEVE